MVVKSEQDSKMKKIEALGFAAFVICLNGLCALAASVAVSDAGKITVSSGDTVVPETEAVADTLPDVGSQPIFHLDASRTNGWTFGENGTSVRKLPSLVGVRYLRSQTGNYIHELAKRDPENGVWDGNDYKWTLVEPELTVDSELGSKVLDFGEQGSRRAFLFDYEHEADTYQKTNRLGNIGTVIALWNSAGGGGTILGGGIAMNGETVNEGALWFRGSATTYSDLKYGSHVITNVTHENAVLGFTGLTAGGPQSAYLPAVNGSLRIDSMPVNPGRTGMNGGWQILSLMPNDALASANGIGLGVVRQNNPHLSGGMKIAEMLIYGECLSKEDVAKVEEYLSKKWLSRVAWGKDGKARAQSVDAPSVEWATKNNFFGTTNVFDIAAGGTLDVGAVTYGRGSGARIVKRGEGSLSVGDLRRYSGTLSVEAGEFRHAPKAIPSSFPVRPVFHIDASDSSSITSTYEEDGKTYVARMESLGTDYKGEPLCAVRQGTYNAPFLRYGLFNDVGGAPAPVLDFYDIVGNGNGITADKTGGFLRIARTNGTTYPYLEKGCTLVAVVSPRYKGGTLVGNVAGTTADPASPSSTGCYFERGQNQHSYWGVWYKPLLGDKPFTRIHPTLTPTNGLVMINGAVKDPLSGYESRGFQVLALRVPASIVTSIGASWSAHWAGGFMLAELALWARPLTEDEMRDVSAHLYAKWFKGALPGYAKTVDEGGVPDVQRLEVSSAASIDVASGCTMRVGEMAAGASLTLSGGGTMEVAAGAEVSSACVPASAPSLHLDASDTNKMYFAANGKIAAWLDKNHRNIAYVGDGNNPELLLENTTKTSLPVVNMGDFRSNIRLTFEKSMNSVRSAYVVMGTSKRQSGGGAVFGSSKLVDGNNENYHDFPYGTDNNGYPDGPFCRNVDIKPWSPLFLADVERYIDGVAVNQTAFWQEDGETYNLYEVHLPVGAHISGICNRNDTYEFSGGGRIAEMVVYERPLTAREKVSTRNYLMKKWLGTSDEDLQDLPEPVASTCELTELSGDGTLKVSELRLSRFTVDVKGNAAVPAVSGNVVLPSEINVAVANAGELSIEDAFVPVLNCPSVSGLKNSTVVFAGDLSWKLAGMKAKLVFENSILGVLFRARRGTAIIVR